MAHGPSALTTVEQSRHGLFDVKRTDPLLVGGRRGRLTLSGRLMEMAMATRGRLHNPNGETKKRQQLVVVAAVVFNFAMEMKWTTLIWARQELLAAAADGFAGDTLENFCLA
ncbi:hypothetical protein L6452_08800 [Arctium lappa]|uniref:Uncharacterized protein n=1 Tax=Arctium lappa TaxID=4217 RepID=A0ACB9DI95_ARCLA|nr:hypothetical protein L6452_08800 [Arctium lappa]